MSDESTMDSRAAIRTFRETGEAWATRIASSAASFVQYPAHAEAKSVSGWRAVRLVAEAGDGSWAGAQVLIRRLPGPFGAMGYVPFGPVVAVTDDALAARLRAALLASFADLRADGVTLLRFEVPDMLPVPEGDDAVHPAAALTAPLRATWEAALTTAGLRFTAGETVQPRSTRVIDLRLGLEAVRAAWHPTRRRYARQAEESGVRVRLASATEAASLATVMGAIAARAEIFSRPAAVYEHIMRSFGSAAELTIAEGPDGTLVGAFLTITVGRSTTWLFGGAIDHESVRHAATALQADAISRAVTRGSERYDLWGLPTAGIDENKLKWAGRAWAYGGAFDVDLDPLRGALARYALRLRRRILRTGMRGLGD